jgi:Kef-type K+ transport system membrane component KefB
LTVLLIGLSVVLLTTPTAARLATMLGQSRVIGEMIG